MQKLHYEPHFEGSHYFQFIALLELFVVPFSAAKNNNNNSAFVKPAGLYSESGSSGWLVSASKSLMVLWSSVPYNASATTPRAEHVPLQLR